MISFRQVRVKDLFLSARSHILTSQLLCLALSSYSSLKALIREPFWLYGSGGLFKPHVVRPVYLKRTSYPTMHPNLTC